MVVCWPCADTFTADEAYQHGLELEREAKDA